MKLQRLLGLCFEHATTPVDDAHSFAQLTREPSPPQTEQRRLLVELASASPQQPTELQI